MNVGVLGLQGDVAEHMDVLKRLKVTPTWVKDLSTFKDVDALIIPGGESTTIGKLLAETGLLEEIRRRATVEKMPIFGTCAGAILLAKDAGEQQRQTKQPLLELMDMQVDRNAYGRQRESFEADVKIQADHIGSMKVPFIRAPQILHVFGSCKAIGHLDGKIVAAEQGNLLAACFHPELTEDVRLHQYFLSKITR